MGRVIKFLFVAFIIAVGFAGYMGIKAIFTTDVEVIVPDVVGINIVDAVNKVQDLGLVIKVSKEVPSLKPKGTIIFQDPEAGKRVKKGRTILVTISKGGYTAPLPDVRGMLYEEAAQKLTEEGFIVGDVLKIHSKRVPTGAVIAQSPAAPAVIMKSSRVDLLVSLGSGKKGKVEVPDVLGQPLKTAKGIIEKNDLKVYRVKEKPTNLTPPGIVMNMWPKPGMKVAPGTGVSLVVAVAPTEASVKQESKKEKPSIPGLNTPAGQQPATAGEVSPVSPDRSTAEQKEQKESVEVKPSKPKKPAKIAKIRYQVPPLSKPMRVQIVVVSKEGKKVLYDKVAKGGEYIKIDYPYYGEIAVQIYLGGIFVWEDRYM